MEKLNYYETNDNRIGVNYPKVVHRGDEKYRFYYSDRHYKDLPEIIGQWIKCILTSTDKHLDSLPITPPFPVVILTKEGACIPIELMDHITTLTKERDDLRVLLKASKLTKKLITESQDRISKELGELKEISKVIPGYTFPDYCK